MTRALWLIGLMQQVKAPLGICVLAAAVNSDHRSYASRYGVLLFTANEFDEYAKATGGLRVGEVGATGRIETWEALFDTHKRYPRLEPAVKFSRHGYWQSADSYVAARFTIVTTRAVASEFDPALELHRAVFGHLVALFLHSLSEITKAILIGHVTPENRNTLRPALLMLLFGGREEYEYRAKLLDMFQTLQQTNRVGADLTLPNWGSFEELIQHCLDSPLAVSYTPLLMLETGFASVGRVKGYDALGFARQLAVEQPQATKLCILAAEYFQRAAALPREFSDYFASELLAIEAPAPTKPLA